MNRPTELTTLPLALIALVAASAALALPAAAEGKKRFRGIDVSRFQGKIDWRKVGKTKLSFVYAQASRGGGGRDCTVAPTECGADRYYRRNYRGARRVGLRVGAYHRAFADGRNRKRAKRDARREARLFSDKVGKVRRRDLLPVLDVEHPFGRLNAHRLRIWIRSWNKVVERRLGVKPAIYTNHSSWQATGDARWFARRGHRLWVAQWGVRRPLVPAGNWAGRGWTIWQFTSSGTVRGINGPVDKNRMRVGLRRIVAGSPANRRR